MYRKNCEFSLASESGSQNMFFFRIEDSSRNRLASTAYLAIISSVVLHERVKKSSKSKNASKSKEILFLAFVLGDLFSGGICTMGHIVRGFLSGGLIVRGFLSERILSGGFLSGAFDRLPNSNLFSPIGYSLSGILRKISIYVLSGRN